jgi:hypothetical protein
MTNRDRVNRMFEWLGEALLPFIRGRLEELYGGVGFDELADAADKGRRLPGEDPLHDIRFLLGFVTYRWTEFRDVLAREERTHINELIDVRNNLAHDFREPSDEYTWRALDTGGRLLARIDPPSAVRLVRMRDEVRERRIEPERTGTAPHQVVAKPAAPHGQDGTLSPVDAIAVEKGTVATEVMNLMGEMAHDLDLVVEDSHAARKYSRRGGAKVWIDPVQGRLVVDLRTLKLRSPTADAEALRRAILHLFSVPNMSDQPGISLSRFLVDRWLDFRTGVLEPFFGVDVNVPPKGTGATYCQRARHFGVPCDSSVTRLGVLERDGWECQMEACLYENRSIDSSVIFSGQGQIPDDIGTIDHIVPLSQVGSPGHVWGNVRAAHRLCNREAFSPSK